MKRLLCVIMLVCMLGCDQEITIEDDFSRPLLTPIPTRPELEYPAQVERPTVNLEHFLRESNWLGSQREGSCVHATMVMLFRWQGREDLAIKWRETYGNGEYAHVLADKLNKEGVRYAYTQNKNDVNFLEWACQSRRGCGVTTKGGAHMVMLVHLDAEWAGIIDNNDIDEVKWIPRQTFLSEWQRSYSWAVTPVYTPPPPLPSKERTK
jgi:hypothetical protein